LQQELGHEDHAAFAKGLRHRLEDLREVRPSPLGKVVREKNQVVLAARLSLVGVAFLEMNPVIELGRANELFRQLPENRPVEEGGLELRVAAGQAKRPGARVAADVE